MSDAVDPRLREWLTIVDYYWQRARVPEADRRRMRTDLEADLLQSLAGGATVDDLVAVDPADFAADLADAADVPARPPAPDPELADVSLLATVLLGAALGAVLAMVTVYRYGLPVMDGWSLSYEDQGLAAIALHAVAACVCVATTLVVVALRFRSRLREQLRSALAIIGLLFVLGGIVSIGPTVAFASTFDYSTSTDIVVTEVAIVLACCSLGVVVARRLITSTSSSRS
jgi:hypothetical protein